MQTAALFVVLFCCGPAASSSAGCHFGLGIHVPLFCGGMLQRPAAAVPEAWGITGS